MQNFDLDEEWGRQIERELEVVRREIAQLRLLSVYDTTEIQEPPMGNHKPRTLIDALHQGAGKRPPRGTALASQLAVAVQRRSLLEGLYAKYESDTAAAAAEASA